MKPPKLPLSREERSEIWKSFWLHAAAATGFIILGVFATTIAEKAGAGGGKLLLMSLIQGGSNFLVWARFVKRIEKYKESTGIPYPSTYFALAIGSFVFIIGPLWLFLSLLIRLSNVPTKPDDASSGASIGGTGRYAPYGAEKSQIRSRNRNIPQRNEASNVGPVIRPAIKPASASRPKQPPPLPPVLHQQELMEKRVRVKLPQLLPSQEQEPPIKDPMVQPTGRTLLDSSQPEPPTPDGTMDDDAFYEEVAKEIESNALKPGVWTRAFAEADGYHDLAKAKYIRLRVAQLAAARNAALESQRLAAEEERERLAVEDEVRQKALQMEAKRRAEEEAARLKAERLEKNRLEADAYARRKAELQERMRRGAAAAAAVQRNAELQAEADSVAEKMRLAGEKARQNWTDEDANTKLE